MESTFYGRCQAGCTLPAVPSKQRGQQTRNSHDTETQRAEAAGERRERAKTLERRGLRPGLSLLTGTVLQSLLGREDTPRHSASRRPDTNVHLGPQATGCHHLSSCPTGEVGTSGGHWSEVWDDPPQYSAPCWVSRGRSLWPPRHPPSSQAAGPALHTRPALERGAFHAYFVLCTVQKELTAPALAPSPALISHPVSSQLAS